MRLSLLYEADLSRRRFLGLLGGGLAACAAGGCSRQHRPEDDLDPEERKALKKQTKAQKVQAKVQAKSKAEEDRLRWEWENYYSKGLTPPPPKPSTGQQILQATSEFFKAAGRGADAYSQGLRGR